MTRLSSLDPYAVARKGVKLNLRCRYLEAGECTTTAEGARVVDEVDDGQTRWLNTVVQSCNEPLTNGILFGVESVRSLSGPGYINLELAGVDVSFFDFLARQLAFSQGLPERFRRSDTRSIRGKRANALACHVFITDDFGNLLIAKRPKTSLLYAGHWSASVTGAVDSADLLSFPGAPQNTVIREVTEELGAAMSSSLVNSGAVRWLAVVSQTDHLHPIVWAQWRVSGNLHDVVRRRITANQREVAEISIMNLGDYEQTLRTVASRPVIPASAAGMLFLSQQISRR